MKNIYLFSFVLYKKVKRKNNVKKVQRRAE